MAVFTSLLTYTVLLIFVFPLYDNLGSRLFFGEFQPLEKVYFEILWNYNTIAFCLGVTLTLYLIKKMSSKSFGRNQCNKLFLNFGIRLHSIGFLLFDLNMYYACKKSHL